ncbi:MAG: SEC-C metal-binding domain-containing protein [Chloroflexota bacterium]
MKTRIEPITTWQGWRDAFARDASPEGWADFMSVSNKDDGPPPWQWSPLFPLVMQSDLTNAMLLACLQLPPASAEAALASLRQQTHALRFDKPPRQLKRAVKEVYRESTKMFLRDLPGEADFFQSLFLHYLRGDYDPRGDANVLLREAQALVAMSQRARALDLAGRAGAAALRGARVWDGWADEGQPEFRHWMLALTTMLEGLAGANIIPLGDVASERVRAAERAAALSPDEKHERKPAAAEPDALDEFNLTEKFVSEWVDVVNRGESLSAGEIAALGPRYDQYVEAAMRVFEMSDQLPPQFPVDMVTSLAVTTIGVMRYTDEFAIHKLIEVIRDQGDTYSDKTISAAIWSLEQLESAALPPTFDFVRYSSDEAARTDMLEVLGHVGRGAAEVWDFLTQQFMDTTWENGKIQYARPLSLLHDARAVPLIADALSDPIADEDDAWELLDALEELSVPFTTNRSKRAVTIPDYGVIEDALPEDWVPRAEREEEETEMEPIDWLDNDEADDEDDEVVFDAKGVAHCPDCGAPLRWVGGQWVHPPVDDFGLEPQRPVRVEKVGRNDPCPCGSGKKYKHCHGRPGASVLN